MPLDFTVVIAVRQRFGDDKADEKPSINERESGIEVEAPFVGAERDYPFQCPAVDRSQFAVLLFQSLGVWKPQGMTINGQPVFGGIPASVDFDTRTWGRGADAEQRRAVIARWNGNVMLIHPGVLQENNVLRVTATEMTTGGEPPRDITARRRKKAKKAKKGKKANRYHAS
jgi:hypothetical protein